MREKYLLCVEVEDIESICVYIRDEDRRAVDEDNWSEREDEVRVEEGRASRFPEQLRIIIRAGPPLLEGDEEDGSDGESSDGGGAE